MASEGKETVKKRQRTPLHDKSPFDRIRSVWVKSFVAIVFAGILILVGEITGSLALRTTGFFILVFFSLCFISAYMLGILQFPRLPGDTTSGNDSAPHEPPFSNCAKMNK